MHRWDPRCPVPRDLVRPVPLDPAGVAGPTRAQASGPRWRRTTRGLYVPATTAANLPEQRILEQSVRLPPGGAVTGWAACRLHRVGLLDGRGRDGRTELPVPLAQGVRGRLRPHPAVLLSNEPIDPREIVPRYGIATACVERAVFDAMRQSPDEREATVALDMALAAGVTSLARMREYVEAHPGWQHVGRARWAVERASPLSRSPYETLLRLVWVVDAGLPTPLVNCPVHSAASGRLLGIADLLDEEAGLVVEFDGAEHRSRDRHTRDVRKDDLLRRAGLEVARVTGTDLASRPLVVERLHAARGRARWSSRDERGWLACPTDLTPPFW